MRLMRQKGGDKMRGMLGQSEVLSTEIPKESAIYSQKYYLSSRSILGVEYLPRYLINLWFLQWKWRKLRTEPSKSLKPNDFIRDG